MHTIIIISISAISDTLLYYLKYNKLFSVNIKGGSAPRLVTTISNGTGFDFHYQHQKMYWVDNTQNKVDTATLSAKKLVIHLLNIGSTLNNSG